MRDSAELRAALERIEAAWARHGATVELVPGLSDSEIDQQLARAQAPGLPDELRQWWRWHDGVGPVVGWRSKGARLGPTLCPLPLSLAMEWYASRLAWAEQDPFVTWDRRWLPVCCSNGDELLLAVDVDTVEAFIVHLEDPPEEPYRPESRVHFVDAVLAWAEALEDGTYVWNPQLGMWDVDLARLQRHPLSETTVML